MKNPTISTKVSQLLPNLQLACIYCSVAIKAKDENLLAEIEALTPSLQAHYQMDTIKENPIIAATRSAYKTLGKEPSRYRPSAEALLRRILNGKGLYQINNLVDLINYTSIKTGFSIGGYNAQKIQGAMELSIGLADDVYEAIGRGILNIEGLPVLRDEQGAFGSPTSDSQRTMLTMDTTEFLMVIFGFNGSEGLAECQAIAIDALKRFAGATNIVTT